MHLAKAQSQESDSVDPYLEVCIPQFFIRTLLSKLQSDFLIVF